MGWTGPEGAAGQVGYDRLILTVGSVNKLLPIPGITDYAHGFRSIAEAMYLYDQIVRQLELASVATDPKSAAARCTFVVVGAGYTGTEVAAQGQLMTTRLARPCPAWPASRSGGCYSTCAAAAAGTGSAAVPDRRTGAAAAGRRGADRSSVAAARTVTCS